jgi:hypothetical protein
MNDVSWHQQFRSDGYAVFRNLVPQTRVDAALNAIADDLENNYDARRQAEYDNQSYCPALRGTSPITNLLTKSPAREILDDALGWKNISVDGGQIAIRKAHNCDSRIAPFPHLDGFSTPLNGVPPDKIYNHTVLVGIFLTPVRTDFAGNFTVWPKSHEIFERYFNVRGPQAMTEPMPTPPIGDPIQINCEPGDVVLAHYHLAHTAAVNTSDSDRIAVFFRVWHRNLDSQRWKHLTHLWEGWKL